MTGSFILLVFLAVLSQLMRSPKFKGNMGEWAMSVGASFRLPKETYIKLENVTLPTRSGTTQIDHVFVSKYGVFVVEVKNMNGWIFGDEESRVWTQTLRGKKYKFQNPLIQNAGHVRAVREVTGLPAKAVISVVAFVGDGQLKTDMPENVQRSGKAISYILSFWQVLLTDDQVQDAIAALSNRRLADTPETTREHIEHLKVKRNRRLSSRSGFVSSDEDECPLCGSLLVQRIAKRGPNTGRQFLGCESFPSCRFTRF